MDFLAFDIENLDNSMMALLHCAELCFLRAFKQRKLESFGYETMSSSNEQLIAKWNKMTKKCLIDHSAADYSLKTLQSKKREFTIQIQSRLGH